MTLCYRNAQLTLTLTSTTDFVYSFSHVTASLILYSLLCLALPPKCSACLVGCRLITLTSLLTRLMINHD